MSDGIFFLWSIFVNHPVAVSLGDKEAVQLRTLLSVLWPEALNNRGAVTSP